ncbi:hypothetical protein BJP25_20005 [Actinokineospora bangkokensis]|uniref:Uncharacterized protein n=1 Tax=Actinokineospora bangkokensis TaxID=1193682 RepID=A0A1Q9LK60_9PSEU|nr:hypothetical protein BJP25_20005 [Actinokineospora bangkokensis]
MALAVSIDAASMPGGGTTSTAELVADPAGVLSCTVPVPAFGGNFTAKLLPDRDVTAANTPLTRTRLFANSGSVLVAVTVMVAPAAATFGVKSLIAGLSLRTTVNTGPVAVPAPLVMVTAPVVADVGTVNVTRSAAAVLTVAPTPLTLTVLPATVVANPLPASATVSPGRATPGTTDSTTTAGVPTRSTANGFPAASYEYLATDPSAATAPTNRPAASWA